VGLVCLLAVLGGLRAAWDVEHGLRVDYFDSLTPGADPAVSTISSEVSTAGILADRSGALPETFRARWLGYLTVTRPGTYTFATTSDDGSTITLDGTLVVDNSGVRGETTRTGQIALEPGPHVLIIEYLQAGGFYSMEWAWAVGGGTPAPVPAWRLTPNRESTSTLQLLRALDIGIIVVSTTFGLLLLWLLWERGQPVLAFASLHPRVASLALFFFLSVVHTWPLATNPAQLSRNDNADTVLNEWALAWVAHQSVTDPLRLYDANIFHPQRYTLAYSEAMIVQSAMGAPLAWLGASPVLVYNLVLLAGFTLTGWVTCLVVARWTGDWTAGLIAGVLNGVNAHTLTRMPHVQALHVEFLPLALFALDALMRDPRIAHAARLALWFTLQSLTSVYLLVFSAFAMVAAAVVRPEVWRRDSLVRVASMALVAAALAGVALLPFLLPYWSAYADQGLTRSLVDAEMYSATVRDYLTTPGRMHGHLWSHRFAGGTSLFPGFVGLALTAVALLTGIAFRDLRARICLAMGVVGVAFSFGIHLPGYETLYAALPLLHAIRAPVRFGYLGIVAVAMLAGFGAIELKRRLPAGVWPPLAALLMVVATIEAFAAPIGLARAGSIPAIYDTIADESGAVVAELPLPDPRAAFMNARYLLNSTRHWKPMINGYSGFVPDSYREHFEEIAGFPDARAIAALRGLGVTHVFVHTNQMRGEAVAEIERLASLQELRREGPIRLYRFR